MGNYEISFEQKKLHVIWAQAEFQKDILHCPATQGPVFLQSDAVTSQLASGSAAFVWLIGPWGISI